MIDLQRRMLHAVYRNGSAHDDSLKPMLSYRRTETTVHALKTYVNDGRLSAVLPSVFDAVPLITCRIKAGACLVDFFAQRPLARFTREA